MTDTIIIILSMILVANEPPDRGPSRGSSLCPGWRRWPSRRASPTTSPPTILATTSPPCSRPGGANGQRCPRCSSECLQGSSGPLCLVAAPVQVSRPDGLLEKPPSHQASPSAAMNKKNKEISTFLCFTWPKSSSRLADIGR